MTTHTDPLERRVRHARPAFDDIAADSPAADALLAEARRRAARPEPPRRRAPRRALRVVALAVVVAAAVVAWPGSASDEATASPVALALDWFSPAPGTILHTRSTLTTPQSRLEQESWQSIDHPERSRLIATQDGVTAESASDGVYDPARDTVYLAAEAPAAAAADPEQAIAAKLRSARRAGIVDKHELRRVRDKLAAASQGGEPAAKPVSEPDPMIAKVRHLLAGGRARATSGDGGWVIALDPQGGARHTLRIDAEGRPLELRIERDGETLQTTRWTTYESLPEDDGGALLSVRAAHPDARVVSDAGAYQAAQARLYPNG